MVVLTSKIHKMAEVVPWQPYWSSMTWPTSQQLTGPRVGMWVNLDNQTLLWPLGASWKDHKSISLYTWKHYMLTCKLWVAISHNMICVWVKKSTRIWDSNNCSFPREAWRGLFRVIMSCFYSHKPPCLACNFSWYLWPGHRVEQSWHQALSTASCKS